MESERWADEIFHPFGVPGICYLNGIHHTPQHTGYNPPGGVVSCRPRDLIPFQRSHGAPCGQPSWSLRRASDDSESTYTYINHVASDSFTGIVSFSLFNSTLPGLGIGVCKLPAAFKALSTVPIFNGSRSQDPTGILKGN